MRLFFLVILILLFPLVHAIDECARFGQDPKDVPCSVVSSYRPTAGCGQTVFIYLTNETSNSTFIQTLQWEDTIPFCQFTWNITSPVGTYIYNSSVESGMITLEREDNMLAVVIVFIFMAGLFIFIGLNQPQGFLKFTTYGLALIEMLIMVWVVWINQAGADITNLLFLNTMICLILGGLFGVYSIYWQTTKFIPIGDKSQFEEDSYVKWQKRKN